MFLIFLNSGFFQLNLFSSCRFYCQARNHLKIFSKFQKIILGLQFHLTSYRSDSLQKITAISLAIAFIIIHYACILIFFKQSYVCFVTVKKTFSCFIKRVDRHVNHSAMQKCFTVWRRFVIFALFVFLSRQLKLSDTPKKPFPNIITPA